MFGSGKTLRFELIKLKKKKQLNKTGWFKIKNSVDRVDHERILKYFCLHKSLSDRLLSTLSSYFFFLSFFGTTFDPADPFGTANAGAIILYENYLCCCGCCCCGCQFSHWFCCLSKKYNRNSLLFIRKNKMIYCSLWNYLWLLHLMLLLLRLLLLLLLWPIKPLIRRIIAAL